MSINKKQKLRFFSYNYGALRVCLIDHFDGHGYSKRSKTNLYLIIQFSKKANVFAEDTNIKVKNASTFNFRPFATLFENHRTFLGKKYPGGQRNGYCAQILWKISFFKGVCKLNSCQNIYISQVVCTFYHNSSCFL